MPHHHFNTNKTNIIMKLVTNELNKAIEYLKAMKDTGTHKGNCDNVITHLDYVKDLLFENTFKTNAETCDILETFHEKVFNEFHQLRKQKGNTRHIQIDGKEVNEIIRLGKLSTKQHHSL